MRVLLFPAPPEGLAGNPYLDLLGGALAQGGAVVEREQATTRAALARLGASDPDVLHLHWLDAVYATAAHPAVSWWKTRTFLHRLDALKKRGTRIAWTVHQLEAHDRRGTKHEAACVRGVMERADAVFVHGEHARAVVRERFPGAPLHVVPHGTYRGVYPDTVDRSAARERLGLPGDAFVYLFLGRVERYKGVVGLADAFRTIADPAAHLVIAGETRDAGYAGELDAVLTERARWDRTRVADDDVQLYLRAADVAVLPYRQIFTSGAAVLATDFDLPVIAPRLGCFVEAFGDDGAILYDEGGLPVALQSALDRRGALPANPSRPWAWDRVGAATLQAYGARQRHEA